MINITENYNNTNATRITIADYPTKKLIHTLKSGYDFLNKDKRFKYSEALETTMFLIRKTENGDYFLEATATDGIKLFTEVSPLDCDLFEYTKTPEGLKKFSQETLLNKSEVEYHFTIHKKYIKQLVKFLSVDDNFTVDIDIVITPFEGNEQYEEFTFNLKTKWLLDMKTSFNQLSEGINYNIGGKEAVYFTPYEENSPAYGVNVKEFKEALDRCKRMIKDQNDIIKKRGLNKDKHAPFMGIFYDQNRSEENAIQFRVFSNIETGNKYYTVYGEEISGIDCSKNEDKRIELIILNPNYLTHLIKNISIGDTKRQKDQEMIIQFSPRNNSNVAGIQLLSLDNFVYDSLIVNKLLPIRSPEHDELKESIIEQNEVEQKVIEYNKELDKKEIEVNPPIGSITVNKDDLSVDEYLQMLDCEDDVPF